MAPVDPGATILWAKNPAYSTALVSRISALSKSEAESLFSSNKSRSAEWKLAKQASLERVTKEVFTAGGDHAREKKQLDSTCRRVAQLFKQYEDSLGLLRQDPYNVAETLDYLRRTYPYWNDLRALLRDHPEASTWDEVEDQARDDEAESDEHGDPMQDVDYPHHQPIAGPSDQPSEPSPRRSLPRSPRSRDRDHGDHSRRQYGPNSLFAGYGSTEEAEAARRNDGDEPRRARETVSAAATEEVDIYGDVDQRDQSPQSRRGEADGRDIDWRSRGRDRAERRSASPLPRQRSPPRGQARSSSSIRRSAEPGDDHRAELADRTGEHRSESRPESIQGDTGNAQQSTLDDDKLTSCPKCSLSLLGFASATSEAHVRSCLDGGPSEGAHLANCPVCDRSLTDSGWDRKQAEAHVDACCRALTGGGTGAGGERRSKRDHVVFECDAKSIPRDDGAGQALECSFCLDHFAPHTRLARLSCYCIFHEECIREYWNRPGDKFCPLHVDLDGPTEVEMRF